MNTEGEKSVLWSFPAAARFGKVIAKSKIYQYNKPTPAVKERFTEQVEKIIWQYKLAPETTNLPAKSGVREIQIFHIQLKTPELDVSVLKCIDDAVQSPLLFELQYQNKVRLVATYKRPHQANSVSKKTNEYFWSEWQPCDIERNPLPTVLNLDSLYSALLKPLIPLTPLINEPIQQLIERCHAANTTAQAIEKLQKVLAREKQFNRKVEINAELKKLKSNYASLVDE